MESWQKMGVGLGNEAEFSLGNLTGRPIPQGHEPSR